MTNCGKPWPRSVTDYVHQAMAAKRLHGDYGPTIKALILLAAYTGMRSGELFALEWSDIDFEAMRIHVHRRVTRAGPHCRRTTAYG
jgi:integrase